MANNLILDPTDNATFTYDARNQLAGITGGPAGLFTGSYDARMRRYQQVTSFNGSTTYLHDQQNVAQSTNALGSSSTVNNYLTMPGSGEVLAFDTTSGGVYVPIHDRLGSTIGLVNAANALQTQYTYDPFGNATTSGQASSYPYLFAGMELDASGLYHTLTRYYDPVFGRFLSADSGLPANPFAYAGDDPVNAVDPSGRSAEFVAGETGSSPPLDDSARRAGGVELAQEASGGSACQAGDCPIPVLSIADSGGDLIQGIIDFFSSLFGGGGGGPTVIPAGYRRHAHYPAMQFISDAQADLQQFTPDLKQTSHAIEMIAAGVIIASIVLAPEVDVAVAAVEGAVELGEAAEGAAETTTLFRAMSPAELEDLNATETFNNPLGIESKYFSTTAEGASSYAQQTFGTGLYQGPYTIVQTSIPTNLLDSSMLVTVDRGISTVVLPTELLPSLSAPNPLLFTPLGP